MKRERRRRVLINKPFQFRYMAWFLLILNSVTLVSLVSIYFGLQAFLYAALTDTRLLNDLITAKRLDEYAMAQSVRQGIPIQEQAEVYRKMGLFRERQKEIFDEFLNRLLRNLSGELFLLFLLIGIGTVFLSHKVAGPLYRFDQSFKEIGRKNLTLRIKLRKFDEAENVSETFNQMAEQLDRAIARMKRLLASVQDPSELRKKLADELGQFKTTEQEERRT